jgi:hypothetical protein
VKALVWIDRHWPWVLVVVVGGGVGLGSQAWADTSQQPILIGRLNQTTRAILYGSLAGSAGALLGLTLATLAILLTLDEGRTIVKEMRAISAWRTMNVTLLFAVACLGATLAMATVALGVDARPLPNEDLEVAVLTASCLAFAELLVGAVAFAIVVLNLTGTRK